MRLVLPDADIATLPDGPALIGSSETCHVRVAGAAPEHARIVGDDLHAMVACAVGFVPLAAGATRRLVPGAVIELGESRVVVEEDLDVPTRELALRSVEDAALVWPCVVVVEGSNVGHQLLMKEERTYAVGRDASSHLVLEDLDASRAHAEIVVSDSGICLRDLGSTRGVYLGATRLEPNRKADWPVDTMARIGKTVLALRVPASMRQRASSSRREAAPRAGPADPAAIIPEDAEPALAPGSQKTPPDLAPTGAILSRSAAGVAEIPAKGAAPRSSLRPVRAPYSSSEKLALASALAVAVAGIAAIVWLLAS